MEQADFTKFWVSWAWVIFLAVYLAGVVLTILVIGFIDKRQDKEEKVWGSGWAVLFGAIWPLSLFVLGGLRLIYWLAVLLEKIYSLGRRS